MALHEPSGRWRLGLLLAFVTAGFWATLPVALKLTLAQLDPYTLTWARFAFAAIVVGAWLAWRGEFARFAQLGRRGWLLLAIAAVMLVGNYLLYLLGLGVGVADLVLDGLGVGVAVRVALGVADGVALGLVVVPRFLIGPSGRGDGLPVRYGAGST